MEAVQALAGAMNDKAATKGILVTTSWFGKASRDFVARNGRMELIDGRNLKSMLLEHLGLDVLIGLPKLPPGSDLRKSLSGARLTRQFASLPVPETDEVCMWPGCQREPGAARDTGHYQLDTLPASLMIIGRSRRHAGPTQLWP